MSLPTPVFGAEAQWPAAPAECVIGAVPGLSYWPEFLTPEEESELLAHVEESPWQTTLKRQVQHYGWTYNYKTRSVRPEDHLGPLPPWLERVAQRLVAAGVVAPHTVLDQVIVNEYLPGEGISPHVDQPAMFGDEVVTISMGGGVTIDYAPLSPGMAAQAIRLEPRSVARIKGDARYRWTHGIAARMTDLHRGHRVYRRRRVSLTFRTVRKR